MAAPAYRRIAGVLRARIADGTYPAGSLLPPASAIAREFSAGTMTAYHAGRLLVESGDAISKPGAGLFVAARVVPVYVPRGAWEPDGAPEFRSRPVAAPGDVAERLGVDAGARVMQTVYTYRGEAGAVWVRVSWEPLALTAGTPVAVPESGPNAGSGVAARMAVIGLPLDTPVLEDAYARLATAQDAGLLGIREGTALLVVTRTHTSGGRPVETSDTLLPPPYRARYRIAAQCAGL